MDRRSFVTSMLVSAGILAVTVGAAEALSTVAPRDLAPADNGNIETVWWRRRWYRRRWYRRRWRRW
jgi:hypothetical protein